MIIASLRREKKKLYLFTHRTLEQQNCLPNTNGQRLDHHKKVGFNKQFILCV